MIAGESRNLVWKGEDSLKYEIKGDGKLLGVGSGSGQEEDGHTGQHSCDVRLHCTEKFARFTKDELSIYKHGLIESNLFSLTVIMGGNLEILSCLVNSLSWLMVHL